MRAVVVLLVGCLGCGDGETPPPSGLPAPSELPVREDPPDPLLMFADESRVTSADDWERRRKPELRTLFSHYVYGYMPEPLPVAVEETDRAAGILGGRVDYVELTLTFGAAPPAVLAIFTPPGVTDAPAFVALNKCGNHTLTTAPEVTPSTAWADGPCGAPPDNRGIRDAMWPVEAMVARGYALVAIHESDFDPDDSRDDRADGVHPHFEVDAPSAETRWGTLAAWSYGLQRAIDALTQSSVVDASRLITVGHSRRGKVALLTAARDERVAMAIPHQSGTGGVTLSRSYGGESVAAITTLFPHWFAPQFEAFARAETRLPLDQHLLVAMVAPRPLKATDGDADDWADPAGARRAVELASPVYGLLGTAGVEPGPDGTLALDAVLTWQSRPGDHALTAEDWARFMDFADLRWP